MIYCTIYIFGFLPLLLIHFPMSRYFLWTDIRCFLSDYCIQWNIRPFSLFSPLSPLLSAGKFKTGRILMFHFICVWANSRWGWNCLQVQRGKTYMGAKIALYTVCVERVMNLYTVWTFHFIGKRELGASELWIGPNKWVFKIWIKTTKYGFVLMIFLFSPAGSVWLCPAVDHIPVCAIPALFHYFDEKWLYYIELVSFTVLRSL